MKWEEIVKIQYNTMPKSSVFYILTLSAIAAFSERLSADSISFKISLVIAILFVLLQNFVVLYLIDTQRQASYAKEQKQTNLVSLNEKENKVRKISLLFSCLATFFIWLTFVFLLI